MTKFKIIPAILTGLSLAVATASPVFAKDYRCTFKETGQSNIIAEVILISHNESTGDVRVLDGIIQHYVGSPIAGTLKSANSKRFLFSWELPSLKDDLGQWIPGTTYSVNIIRASNAATISANPSGNYRGSRGKGTCTPE